MKVGYSITKIETWSTTMIRSWPKNDRTQKANMINGLGASSEKTERKFSSNMKKCTQCNYRDLKRKVGR